MSSRRCAGLFVLAILILQIVGVSRAAAELYQTGESAGATLCTSVSGAASAVRVARTRIIDQQAAVALMRPCSDLPEPPASIVDAVSGVQCARCQPSARSPLGSRPPPLS